MLKKYSIIALLLFSYTIILGHSIIPHHHHDHHEIESSHPDHDHHDHDQDRPEDDDHDNDDSGLAHDFGNYFHAGETGDFHQQSAAIKISCNTIATAYIISSFTLREGKK